LDLTGVGVTRGTAFEADGDVASGNGAVVRLAIVGAIMGTLAAGDITGSGVIEVIGGVIGCAAIGAITSQVVGIHIRTTGAFVGGGEPLQAVIGVGDHARLERQRLHAQALRCSTCLGDTACGFRSGKRSSRSWPHARQGHGRPDA